MKLLLILENEGAIVERTIIIDEKHPDQIQEIVWSMIDTLNEIKK